MTRTAAPRVFALGALGAVILLLAVGRCAEAQTLTVGRATIGRAVPSGFVGLSIELTDLENYAGRDPTAIDPVFLQLLENLAPGQSPVLRIGGDSTDWTWWPVSGMRKPAGIRYVLTPAWMQVARATALDAHAKLILGVNFEADSARLAAAEGRAMVDQIGGPSIDALEIGNEPELFAAYPWYTAADGKHVYGRPVGWDELSFNSDFGSIARAMPDAPLAGPASGSPTWLNDDLGAFLRSEPRVKLATIHAYPLKHCVPSDVLTDAELLSDASTSGYADELAPYVAVAHRRGTPIRVDEMNAVACGGYRGISDTFASSLWVLDALFDMAKTGVDGVNIHTVPGTINEELGPSFAHGTWSMRVHPEYYGMMMFAQAAPPGSHLLRLAGTPPSGVKAFATEATNGAVRIVLINDGLARAQTIRLRVALLGGPATEEQLRAPSIHATSAVTLGGQSFGAATTTGLLAGAPTLGQVTAAGGTYTVSVPAASATLLTLSPPVTAG